MVPIVRIGIQDQGSSSDPIYRLAERTVRSWDLPDTSMVLDLGGGGRHRTANVPRDFAAHRGATAAATTSADVRRSMVMHSRVADGRSACQMPGKMAKSDPRPSVRVTRGAGSGQHLASVLQEGRENTNIDAGLGFIWRISVDGSAPINGGYFEPDLRQPLRTLFVLLIKVFCSFAAAGHASAQSPLSSTTIQNDPTGVGVIGSSASPAYPLKVSANNRYLVDQNDVPFLMVGDSPQALIGNLSAMEAAFFMEDRRRYGINALWINLLCNDGTACNEDGTTFDGIAPFTTANDLSTPNPAYFERADGIINLAAANGMVVLLDPIETAGWLRTLRANGNDKAFGFGQYLGNRYKNFPNT